MTMLSQKGHRPVVIEEIAVPTSRFGTLTAHTAGAGDDVLVLLHGIGGNAYGWSAQLLEFGVHYRVIAWNAPGYCESSAMAVPNPALEHYAEAVIALLDGLGLSDRIHALGHSFGGLVASRVAATYPDRVDRMILAGCSSGHRRYPEEDRERILKTRLAFTNEIDPVAYARGRAANLLSSNPDPALIDRAVAILARLRQPGFSHATRMISEADIFEHASQIAAPTRVICGTEDRVTPESLNRQIAAAIDRAEYVSIPHAGHWSFLENPVAFNRAVLEFLPNEVPSTATSPTRV